jgi:hypothetical protein
MRVQKVGTLPVGSKVPLAYTKINTDINLELGDKWEHEACMSWTQYCQQI